MQAGFTLETGFTRSKNTGNIIMKNLMDFCIGSVAFWAIGYLNGTSIGSVIGTPSWF
jgi:Amt family ammonium transporter